MNTLEITGTTFGTPRPQWAAETNAGTGTSGGTIQSCVYLRPSTDDGTPDTSLGLWSALTNHWELVRLSRRTPWSAIIGPGFTQGSVWATVVMPHAVTTPEAPIGYIETLGRVKHYLSLNTSELAAVLGVGRPTVYAWMQGGPMRPTNRERLALVYGIATKWWNRSKQPLGSFLQLKGANGQSVFDLLKADVVDEAALEPFFKVAAHRIERAAQEKGKRAESYQVLAERHGFAPVPEGIRDRTLRQFNQGRKSTK